MELLPVFGTSSLLLLYYVFITLWYYPNYPMAWLLGVKLLNPIYKKSSCYKNVSFGWCIFLNPEHNAVPLFTSSKILSLNMLYVETVSSIMFSVSCLTVPTNISNLFIKANEKHNHKTRFSSSCNFYINRSRLNQNHGSFARFGAKLWNSVNTRWTSSPPQESFQNT